MLFNFFFVGLTTLSKIKLSYFKVLWNELYGIIILTFFSWGKGYVFFLISWRIIGLSSNGLGSKWDVYFGS